MLTFTDCGELSGEEAENIGKGTKQPDKTGDPYEDFPEDEGGSLKGSQILEIATKLKDIGNKSFKEGDLEVALQKYQKGIRYLNEYPEPLPEDPPELSKGLTHIRFTLHSNSSLLQIKLKAYEAARTSADYALGIEAGEVSQQDRAKASYRKALALLGLKDDEEAVKSLETAQKLAPGDAAIQKELGLAKKKAADQAKKEKAAYKKFFD